LKLLEIVIRIQKSKNPKIQKSKNPKMQKCLKPGVLKLGYVRRSQGVRKIKKCSKEAL
jgi:hypothetical protein